MGIAAAVIAAAVVAGVGLYAKRGAAGADGEGSASEQGLFASVIEAASGDSELAARGTVPWPFRFHGGRVRLPLRDGSERLSVPAYPQERATGPLHALAYQYATRIFERASNNPRPLGIVRRGTQLFALERVYGPGCKGGWYTLADGGLACTADGFHITDEEREFSVRQLPPRLDQPLPFQYGKIENGALRYYRIPTPREQRRIAAYAARTGEEEGSDPGWPEVVDEQLDGAYFAALDRIETDHGHRYYRTVRGRYVHEQDVELRELPPMHGELLGGRWKLPIGFVHGEEPVEVTKRSRPVGSAEKHARLPVERYDDRVVVGPGGFELPRERVRVARRMKVPEGVPARAKWVHINLTEQTLVAYEGRRPVFATLISSGLEEPEFATPTGVYQVREKHVSVTMNGPDPDAGRYEVEEVPWTQYYYESYAVHGAYWHNEFGRVRSHGCTNLSPTDARWLFHWTSPELPPGWHARRRAEGTYLVFTRDEG